MSDRCESGTSRDCFNPPYSETSLDDDSIIADCPGCHDPMLLGHIWKELIDEDDHEIPKCPDCVPEEWADDAEPKISGLEVAALAK